ncbi:MAG: hypothetical protein ACRYFS_19675 [Janthinobacterium lividum]
MIDFEQTYLHRKAVYRAVQQSQKSESQVAERIGKIAVAGKQELLLLLSAWLLELDTARPLSEAERAEVAGLSQMPLEKWVLLQGVADQIETDLKAAESEEKAALAAFQKQAPFGAANKLFAAGEKRAQLQALQDEAAIKQKRRESLSIALRQNSASRQALGKTFLRDCLSWLDTLSVSQIFGKEATAIISRMTGEIGEAWAGHQKQQMEEFSQMAGLVEALRESYKGMPEVLPQQAPALPDPGMDTSPGGERVASLEQ